MSLIPGDRVVYVPRHATHIGHADCEQGVVSSVIENRGTVRIFVRYDDDQHGRLTPAERLVKV